MIVMRIDELINDTGLKRKYICRKMGIDQDTLKNWSESRSFPKLNKAVQLADVLGCNVNDLYERDE